MILGSLFIYKDIIAQEKENGDCLHSRDVLEQSYVKSMRVLVDLLREGDDNSP
jgi:hypothetical protein